MSSQAPSPCGRSKMPAHALTLTREFSGPSAVRWSLLRIWPYLQTLSKKLCYLGWSSASLTSERRALTAQMGCVAWGQVGKCALGRRQAAEIVDPALAGHAAGPQPVPRLLQVPIPAWEMRRLDEKDLYGSSSSSTFVSTTISVSSFP